MLKWPEDLVIVYGFLHKWVVDWKCQNSYINVHKGNKVYKITINVPLCMWTFATALKLWWFLMGCMFFALNSFLPVLDKLAEVSLSCLRLFGTLNEGNHLNIPSISVLSCSKSCILVLMLAWHSGKRVWLLVHYFCDYVWVVAAPIMTGMSRYCLFVDVCIQLRGITYSLNRNEYF